MLLAGSTRPSMKLYRFFVSFCKYIIYNIFSKVRDVVHPVCTRKGVEGIKKIKKRKKKLCGFNYFYFAAQTAKKLN